MKKTFIVSLLTISLILSGCSSSIKNTIKGIAGNQESSLKQNNNKELNLKGKVVKRTENKFVFVAVSGSDVNSYIVKPSEEDKDKWSKLRKDDKITIEGTIDGTYTEGKVAFYMKSLEIDEKEADRNEEESEKKRQESLVVYTDLIKEIENEFSDIKVNYIVGENEKKTMSLQMQMLTSQELTLEEIERFTVKKETRLKDEKIQIIFIFVKDKDKDKDVGTVSISLRNGKYEKILNKFD